MDARQIVVAQPRPSIDKLMVGRGCVVLVNVKQQRLAVGRPPLFVIRRIFNRSFQISRQYRLAIHLVIAR
jgi:hypothetical protein